MITVELCELAGNAYKREHVARFWAPFIVRPYDPTGQASPHERAAFRVAARQFIKFPSSVKG